MANENIGDISCPFGCGPAHIRRYNSRKPPKDGDEQQRGKFYIHCKECGPILASSAKVQNYILEKGRFYNADELAAKAKETPAPKAAPKAAPEKAPSSTPAKKVSFDFDPYA